MKIAGFQPITLSDYPGLTAAIIFTQGCNFRCPFCHNGSLLHDNKKADNLIESEEVFAVLKKRKSLLDGVVITGGEPTLQPDLLSFMKKVKRMDYKVKLDTNGSNPEMLEELLKHGVLDYIAMDVKAPLAKYNKLAGVEVRKEDVCRSMEMISASGIDCEFRTTYVKKLLTEQDIDTIRSYLPEKAKYRVQKFIPENALDKSLLQTDERSVNV